MNEIRSSVGQWAVVLAVMVGLSLSGSPIAASLWIATLAISIGPTVSYGVRPPSTLRLAVSAAAATAAAAMLIQLGLRGSDAAVAAGVVLIPAIVLLVGGARVATPILNATSLFFPIVFGSLAFFASPAPVSVVLWLGLIIWLAVLLRNESLAPLTKRREPAPRPPNRWLEQSAAVVLVAIVAMIVAPGLAELASRGSQFDPSGNRLGAGDGVAPYWGFTDTLDTSTRGDLPDTEMLRVRATTPSFWRGQTFDTWDGQIWRQSKTRSILDAEFAAPTANTRSFTQVVTVLEPLGDIVFGASEMTRIEGVGEIRLEPGGARRTAGGLSDGTEYRVTSDLVEATPRLLRANGDVRLYPKAIGPYALPLPITDRVAALASELTRDQPTSYDKVMALQGWIAENISYDLDSPVPPQGSDAIDEMVFGHRRGFCEQIGTALTVMARSVGIPARLAVGYVPSSYDRLRGEWVSKGSDAHAWVEVWFPNAGWVGFDPTAEVPLAGEHESPGVGALLSRVALAFVVAAAVLGAGLGVRQLARRRRHRPDDVGRLVARFDRVGKDRGGVRRPQETFAEYADRLSATVGSQSPHHIASALDAAVYGSASVDLAEIGSLVDDLDKELQRSS